MAAIEFLKKEFGLNGEITETVLGVGGKIIRSCTEIPLPGTMARVADGSNDSRYTRVVPHNDLNKYVDVETGLPVKVIDGPYKF
ncbi:MAG: hypothetical protein KAT83_01470 [Candidatus Aenigmarchaeota archaeon]|nr:hypothetical protein [Candidatus Aenigmarchaeota archaeon]